VPELVPEELRVPLELPELLAPLPELGAPMALFVLVRLPEFILRLLLG
jgi:hypothetical protein